MTMNAPRNTNDDRALVSIEGQQPPTAIIPGKNEWTMMRDMAASLVPTGFLPDSIKTPEQAVAIMLKGRELSVPPMYALSNIAIVKGKPTISAEMMLALIYRDHGKRAIRVKESTNERCIVEYRLDGWDDVSSYTFTIQDAQKANLANSPTWKNYPAAMLRARCISAVARMAFPECIAGMYVPGELGEAVSVTEEGEVMSVAATVDQDTGEIRQAPTQRAADTWQRVEAYIDENPDVIDAPAQASLVDDGADRDKANAYAHAVADGLFGDKGHDVLHILASQKWGYDSVRQCSADQLRTLGKTLETKADDPDNFDNWFNKWIAPHMPQDEQEAE